MIDLAMIQEHGLIFANRRALAKSCPSSFSHLQTEVAEAWDEYQQDNKEALALELADIVLVTTSIAAQLDIDLEQAIKEKHLINLRRVP